MAFRSLTESIDTSTPGGKLTFPHFGALAEFEERTMAGPRCRPGSWKEWWHANGVDNGEG